MPRSPLVDGFALAYERSGSGPPVVLLHGWPGDRSDYRLVGPLLAPGHEIVVPDLRGFGESDKHAVPPGTGYSVDAQARSVVALIEELGLERVVLAGYDIGSRIAQAIARTTPALVSALVLTPPLPGVGDRVLAPDAQREFWYQAFHQLELAERLVDGNPSAVRSYLEHFWSHWSGPGFALEPAELDRLAERYAAPGAFTASIAWYRAGAGAVQRSLAERPPAASDRIGQATDVLWPAHDPLFPWEWSDRLDEFFADITVSRLEGSGHFVPLEAPDAFAAAIHARSISSIR